MRAAIVIAISLLVVASSASKCYIDVPQIYSHIKTPLKNIPAEQLPTDFTWANANGVNYLTLTR